MAEVPEIKATVTGPTDPALQAEIAKAIAPEPEWGTPVRTVDSPDGPPSDLRWRSFDLTERADADGGVRMAVSSDAIVDMPWGRERLLHGPDNVEVARRGKVSLLMAHQLRDVRGSATDFRTDGHKLRAVARFAGTDRGREARTLVEEGHLDGISVGYQVLEQRKASDEQGPYYEVTKWRVREVSLAAVPADYEAGVGRSAAGADGRGGEPNSRQGPAEDGRVAGEEKGTAPVAVDVTAQVREGVNQERERVNGLRALGRATKMEDKVDEWIAKDVSVDAARAQALDTVVARAEAAAKVETPAGFIDFSERERKAFSICRLITAAATRDWSGAGLEKEAHDTMAKRLGRDNVGDRVFLPMATPLNVRASVTGQVVGTASLGGSAVQTTVMPLIEMLKNLMVVKRAGARVLSGLRDNLSFPRQITANTFNWVGENPSSANTLGALTFDTVTMSPKVGMVSTAFSRLALIQPSFDMEQLVISDIASQAALGYDLAALHGTGTGQPRGIFNQTGVNTVTFGSGQGAVPTFGKLVDFQTALKVDNAPFESLSYITTPGIRGKLMQTLKSTTAGSAYIWEDERIAGYGAYATNQIEDNFTTGTTAACHGVVFGNFSELLLGEWGGVGEIQVNPYLYSHQNVIAVDLYLNVDAAVRHPVSFCVATDALAA